MAETEKRLVREQLDTTKGEVLVERQEKAKLQEHATKLQEHATKLAEGVSVLAAKSGELKQEVTVLTEKSGELKQEVSALADKSGELKQEIRENRPWPEQRLQRVRHQPGAGGFPSRAKRSVRQRNQPGEGGQVRPRAAGQPGLCDLPCQRYAVKLLFSRASTGIG